MNRNYPPTPCASVLKPSESGACLPTPPPKLTKSPFPVDYGRCCSKFRWRWGAALLVRQRSPGCSIQLHRFRSWQPVCHGRGGCTSYQRPRLEVGQTGERENDSVFVYIPILVTDCADYPPRSFQSTAHPLINPLTSPRTAERVTSERSGTLSHSKKWSSSGTMAQRPITDAQEPTICAYWTVLRPG